jgi:hypothetical protein
VGPIAISQITTIPPEDVEAEIETTSTESFECQHVIPLLCIPGSNTGDHGREGINSKSNDYASLGAAAIVEKQIK